MAATRLSAGDFGGKLGYIGYRLWLRTRSVNEVSGG